MYRMKRICLAATMLLSGYPLMAQPLTFSNPRAAVFVSGSFVAGNREFLINSNSIRTEYANGAKVGFRFGADLNENWGAEVAYSFGGNNLRVINLNPPRREREFDTHVHQLLANGSYFFSPADEKWRPFATFEIGVYRWSPTDHAKGVASVNFLTGPTRISSSTKFGVNFGGGLEGKMSEHVGVRFDLRDHLMGIPRYGVPETPLNPG